jgi:NAD(P)-dependent dehydrogenase (short-subunit alcohol dehydrogenase family)
MLAAMTTAAPLTIVTGASRGLGRAMAAQRLRAGHRVLTMARRPDPSLEALAPPGLLAQWAVDLARPAEVAARLEAWLAALPADRVASAALVNNAAILTPPGPITASDPAALADALRVGLEAPVLLARAFLHATDGWTVPRKVLNISSGLGRFAMAGSAPYCAVKAGLDHFSRALALDEALKTHGARVVSLAPGVIDTDMQVQLRGADPSVFSEQHRFAAMKTSGALDSADAAAAKVLAFLDRADFGAQPIADVREA